VKGERLRPAGRCGVLGEGPTAFIGTNRALAPPPSSPRASAGDEWLPVITRAGVRKVVLRELRYGRKMVRSVVSSLPSFAL